MGYEVQADTRQNRLYLSLSGRMDREEIDAAAAATKETVREFDEAFDVINDLSGFKPVGPEDAKPIKETQHYLVERGVDRVIRVVDDETSTVITQMFERRSKDAGYSGETADSIEEAERLLERRETAGYAG
jgi:hypothetical protein